MSVSEVYREDGPTGQFVAVVSGVLVDAGGNILYEGSAEACERRRARYRIPTRLQPTRIGGVVEPTSGDVLWGSVVLPAEARV
jgi:hypothetical protein